MQQPKHQFSLDLIEHQVASSVVQQRKSDGYINATALCEAAKKHWHQYEMLETTGSFLRRLSDKTGISKSSLVQRRTSAKGVSEVWIHPKVAVHLAQWLSPDFAVQVAEWVYEWMDGGAAPGRKGPAAMPPHIARHMLNFGKIPPTHFSILQEMTHTLIAPLEASGYTLPEKLVPDISQGKMFCKFLRDELGIDTDALPTYNHEYLDGRVYPAKLYPAEHLGAFRLFISEVWLPARAAQYFKERDPSALPHLDKLLRLTYQAKPASPKVPPPPPRRTLPPPARGAGPYR